MSGTGAGQLVFQHWDEAAPSPEPWHGWGVTSGRVLCLFPRLTLVFSRGTPWEVWMAISPPWAPQSPSGMGSWLFPVAACLGGIPESPQGLCAMQSLSDGNKASAGNVFFSFSPSSSSHLLSGKAAELSETGAVCLLGARSWGMAVGFVDFSELTTCW